MSKMLLPLFAFFMVFAMPLGQAADGQVRTDTLTATLSDAVMTGENRAAAVLDIELAPGWHTYWRAPGDAGLAPVLNTDKTPAIKGANFEWPYPVRMEDRGIVTFGYRNRVSFPLNFSLIDGASPTSIDLSLQIMVCKDICIPETIDLHADFSENADVISALAAAREKIPQADVAGLAIETITAEDDYVVIAARASNGFDKESGIFLTVGDIGLTNSPQWLPGTTDPTRATIKIPRNSGAISFKQALKSKTLSVTLVSGGQSTEKTAAF